MGHRVSRGKNFSDSVGRCVNRMNNSDSFAAAHGSFHFCSTQCHGSGLSRKTKRAQSCCCNQRIDQLGQIRSNDNRRLQRFRENVTGRGLLNQVLLGNNPTATPGQLVLQIRNDRTIRRGDKPDHLVRVARLSRDYTCAIVHLISQDLKLPVTFP